MKEAELELQKVNRGFLPWMRRIIRPSIGAGSPAKSIPQNASAEFGENGNNT
jgi:hypothetical protein